MNNSASSRENASDESQAAYGETMRLQKFLARAGVDSRRACEAYITAGRVKVNGEVVTELGTKVNPAKDVVEVDGSVVTVPSESVTIMLHKPAGYVSAMKPQAGERTVAELIPLEEFPALYHLGRLDADTTGLLLFSTDGELGHNLLHPSHHVNKTYEVTLKSPLTTRQKESLEHGVSIEGATTAPAVVEPLNGDSTKVAITIHEGKYHQVKLMFEAVGNPLVKLHRTTFGPIELGDLPEGSWRFLTAAEVSQLGLQGRC